MATIPLQVASRSLDTGNVVSYPAGGEIGRALQGAGNELDQITATFARKQDQQARFDAGVVDDELRQRLAQTETEAVQNAPADGSGIHDSVYGQLDVNGRTVKPGSFDTLFDEYAQKVPESQRANFMATKEAMKLAGSNRLAGVQHTSRQAYEQVELTKSQDTLLNGILTSDPNDTKTFEAFKQNGLDRIANSGMDAPAKKKAAYNWEQSATKGLFKSMLEKDPTFAGKARAALGLAPPQQINLPTDQSLPAGMRNNNPGNIKFVGTGQAAGVIGPSANKDQGDSQAVFATPEAGMRAAYDLALRKYDGGKTTANQMIAGDGGWTPGNTAAAKNIAATMGLGPDDDLGLSDPNNAAKFLRALVTQEHGPASQAYTDSMITNAVSGGPSPTAPKHAGPDLPIVFGNTAGRVSAVPDVKGIHPEVLTRFKGLQNALGESLPVVSGFRDAARNERAGGAKASQHIEGNALDLDVSGKSQAERVKIIQAARAQGFGGIGVYANSIHIDTGPVRAWGASHHGDSLPTWARAALDGSPGGTAPQADPRFANLAPEDRLSLANQADVQYRQQQATALATEKADYTAYKDRYVLGIVQGQIADPAIISNDTRLNDGDKAYLLRSFNEQNKGVIQLQSDLVALNGNGLSLDPYSSDDKKRADNLYGAAVGKVPLEQQAALGTAIIEQTGVVPQPLMNDMRRGLSSTNPAQVVAAAQSAQKIAAFDPAALGRRDGGSEVQKAADDFSYYVNKLNLPPDEAARRMIENASPEKQRDRKALEPAAKEFVKTMGDVDLSGEFKEGGFFSGAPALGMDPMQGAGIKADFLAIAEDQFYSANGNPDLAKNRALEQMKAIYGVSGLSGAATVVKYPPERYWPKQDSSGFLGVGADPFSYAKTQLHTEIDGISGRGPAGPLTTFEGRLQVGNIDLANRPQVKNPDGSVSTVRSMSFQNNAGQEVLIPTVAEDGSRILSNKEAMEQYGRTGKHLGIFDTPEHATAYAEALHKTQEQYYRGDLAIDPSTVRLVTTPETEADVKAGRLPGYAVMWKDANGNLQTIPGKVWRPDVSHMLAGQEANRAKTQAETTAAARRKDIEAISGQDRGFSMDNMLGGNTKAYTPENRAQFLDQQRKDQPKPDVGGNIPSDIPAPEATPGSAM